MITLITGKVQYLKTKLNRNKESGMKTDIF